MPSGVLTTLPDSVLQDRALGSVGRLLDEGRYDEAAKLVRAVERSYEAAGEPLAAEILGAVHRLCLACGHQRAGIEARARALNVAADLERRLRERLHGLLELAAAAPGADASGPAPALRAPVRPAPARRDAGHGRLAIHCLGSFCVYEGERSLGPWPSRRAKAVFKFLVLHRDRPMPKDVLMETFWPEAGLGPARNNLNVAVHGLRRFLREEHADLSHVLYRDECYVLNPDLRLWVDVEQFRSLLASAAEHERDGDASSVVDDLQAAEALYQGGLFDDDPYEEWMLPLRRELQDTYVDVLERLRDHHLASADLAACTTICRKLLAVEPYREDAHRELMRCYARQGHHHLALRQYDDCRKTLRTELGTEPSRETSRLHEQISAHEPV